MIQVFWRSLFDKISDIYESTVRQFDVLMFLRVI